MAKRFKLSDDSVNSYGFRVLTAGIDLTQFRKNPVMLYDHDDWKHLPIGRWENISVEADGLYADAVFDMKDEFAAQISQKVEDGILNMVSIGIRRIEESSDPALLLQGQTYPTISKSKMREASIVSFGSNDNALALYDDNGKLIELNDKNLPSIFKANKDFHQPENNMKLINLKLSLKDDAQETEVVAAIDAILLRATNAETELLAFKKKESEKLEAEDVALVDGAIAEQRLDAKVRETILTAMKTDRVNQRIILASIPKRQTAKEVVDSPDAKADEALLKMSWSEADKAGKTAEMKAKFPEEYKAKFKAEFGTEPKM